MMGLRNFYTEIENYFGWFLIAMPVSTNHDLLRIPGVGPSISACLVGLGIHSVQDLKGRNSEALYEVCKQQHGGRLDRCVLYVFRCAVYFASNRQHDPELLKWWNWKDRAS